MALHLILFMYESMDGTKRSRLQLIKLKSFSVYCNDSLSSLKDRDNNENVISKAGFTLMLNNSKGRGFNVTKNVPDISFY